jgi:hypothetical protein
VKRSLLPVLLILALAAPGTVASHAAEPGSTATASPPSATAGAPAALQVQAHQTVLRIRGRTLRGSTTWTVVVLDPAAADLTAAPSALDGVSSKGATITGGRLDLPDGLAPGTVLSFQGPVTAERSPFAPSGIFSTVPGVPTDRAELIVRVENAPLSIWTDPRGVASYKPGRSHEARVVWSDLGPDDAAEAIWSTGGPWLAAGEELERSVAPMLTDKVGRVLEQGIRDLSPARIAERVLQEIRLVDGPDVGWQGRPARYAIESGSGTRAERGAVLLSVLRKAGFDARPALVRPADIPGSMPTSVTAPSLLPRPAVAVVMPDRIDWIDPGAADVNLPGLPANFTGGVAWAARDLPRVLEATGAAEGTVPISAELRLTAQGEATFTATMTATGTADGWLRETLGPMTEEQRAQVLRPMVAQGRPALDRLTVSMTGFEDRSKPVQITLHGKVSARLAKVSTDLVSGEVPPLIAPALAAWLPPRMAVHEELAVTPPPGLRLLTLAAGPHPTHPAAVVSRSDKQQGDRVVLITDVERPTRHLPPSQAAQATAALDAAALAGPELFFVRGQGNPRAAKTANRDVAERVTLEALLWWRHAKYRNARKLLGRYLAPVGVGALDEALVRMAAPYELRRELVELAESDPDRLATVPILIGMDRADEAWIRAAEVSTTRVHTLRVEARLWMVRLQGASPPDATTDPEGAARWRDPDELLAEADASAKMAGGKPDPRVLAARARRHLDAGRIDAARALLETAVSLTDDPNTAVMLAEAAARAGDPLDDVRDRLDDAVSRASADPVVLGTVSDALARLGAREAALERALAAARLSGRDAARWGTVVDRALDAGELQTALFAAARASDLSLSDAAAASTLTRVATLAGDSAAANLGWSRGGTPLEVSWPPQMSELLPLVGQDQLLALLRHHDVLVVADPGLLSLRAQLELAQGSRSRAFRDGTLLNQRHGIARGTLVAFAAALGESWSSLGTAPLDALVRADPDPAARAARLELRALFGGSITDDVRAMRDDRRAKLWREATAAPDDLAAKDPEWRAGLPTRGTPPPEYRTNPVLGATKGVAAWSQSDSRRTIVRHRGNQLLPPPLSLLYTVQNPPLRSLPDGGRVYALDGGSIPLFAAVRTDGDETALGLGTSPEEAARALASVPPL